MANYHDHRATGFGWWLAASLALFAFGGSLGLSEGGVLLAVAVGLPATLLGAAFPDVDLSSSIPHRRLRLALFAVTTLLALWLLAQPVPQSMLAAALDELAPGAVWHLLAGPLATLTLAGLVGAAAVALLAFLLPPHRGVTHRWPAGLVVALALAALVGLFLRALAGEDGPALVATLSAAGFFVLGFASHLFKDGLLLRRGRKRP